MEELLAKTFQLYCTSFRGSQKAVLGCMSSPGTLECEVTLLSYVSAARGWRSGMLPQSL